MRSTSNDDCVQDVNIMKSVHSPEPAAKSEESYKTYLQGVAISTALGLMFWGLFHFTEKDESTASPPGEERLQIGHVSTEGYSRRGDRSIVIYTVKAPSRNPTARLAERTLYARRNSCNKPRLEIGDTVFLKVMVTQKQTTITSAYTLDGCVLQDAAVLKQMSAGHQKQRTTILLTFGAGALFFTAAAFLSWIRQKKPHLNSH